MSQRDDEQLAVIDIAALDAVTGGASTDEQITEALKNIQSTIDGLKSNNNNNGQWLQWFIPLLLISRGGGSFSYSGGGFNINSSACGCGCGGLGLCRRR